jgi:hypothetical protein
MLFTGRFPSIIPDFNYVKLDEFYILRYNAVQSVENHLKFRRNISPLSSGSKCNPSKKPAEADRKPNLCLPHAFTLVPYFDPEDGGRHIPPKRRLTFNELYGIIFYKIEPFITTAV